MSIAEGLLAGLQQPLSLEGAQLPADMSLYAGGGLDVLKAHEQKYKQQEYLDKQIKRNSKRLARELAKAYEISGYPEEQEKMSSVTDTPFIGSNVHSRRQYLLSKLAEKSEPDTSLMSDPTGGGRAPRSVRFGAGLADEETLMSDPTGGGRVPRSLRFGAGLADEEPAPAEVASPQHRVTGGFGPVHRLQMPPPAPPGQISVNGLPPRELRFNTEAPDPRDKPVPTIEELQAKARLPEQLRIARGGEPVLTDSELTETMGEGEEFKPPPAPFISDQVQDVGQRNVYKPPPPTPEAPGILSRIGGGLGRGMNYLEGLGAQAVRQGSYGAQQLANLALRNSDYLSGLVDDDQEARILGNLMQGAGTAGDEAFYGQQLQALRDRVNSPGRTQMQQGVLDTLARGIGRAGNQMPAQARALRNMHLEEQGRMMGIIPEGQAATPEQMARLEKELGPAYDYFQGTSPEAQQAGVSAFGQPGGFTPLSQYLGDAADQVVARSPEALNNAFGQAREYAGLPALNNAFRRARNALGFEDQMMVDPAKVQAQAMQEQPEYLLSDIGDVTNISDEDIDQQFMQMSMGGLQPIQIADSMLNRNMAPTSRDTLLRAIQLYDSGNEDEAMDLLESLSPEDAARATRIMEAQQRAEGAPPT